MTTYAQALARIEEEIAKIDFFRGVMRTEPGSKDREDLWRLRKAVLELHGLFGIYDECGHSHTDEEAEDPNSGVLFINHLHTEIAGWTCATADLIIKGVLGE